MKCYNGGDLCSREKHNNIFFRQIFRKMLLTVRYMHNSGIVHRDCKFKDIHIRILHFMIKITLMFTKKISKENIMFEIKQPNAEINIIDFGLARTFLPDATGSD